MERCWFGSDHVLLACSLRFFAEIVYFGQLNKKYFSSSSFWVYGDMLLEVTKKNKKKKTNVVISCQEVISSVCMCLRRCQRPALVYHF